MVRKESDAWHIREGCGNNGGKGKGGWWTMKGRGSKGRLEEKEEEGEKKIREGGRWKIKLIFCDDF